MDFFNKLLNYYSISSNEYEAKLKSDIFDELDITSFKNAEKIADFIKKCILEGKKILIYGDYDCDGIMSTSILFLTIATDKFKPGFYIPNRESDGYGLNKKNIDMFHKLGYEAIICVDNGISLINEVEYAKSLGIQCVILDHHKILKTLPKTEFIMHPEVDNIGDYNISAGEVCFFFSIVYLKKIDPYFLALATLSTFSDVMPLISYNKILARKGLEAINQYKFNEILLLLDNKSGLITEDDLYLKAIPKINSIGRICNDTLRFNIVRYFIRRNDEHKLSILKWINNTNEYRKEIIKNSSDENIVSSNNAIFFENENNEGISGLIANSVLTKFKKPTFVYTKVKDNPSMIKGSARSYENFNIAEALQECSDILENYGGHCCAGGFSLKISNLNEFEKRINEMAKELPILKKNLKSIVIDSSELTLENYDIYRTFGPFGEGNEKPLFEIKKIPTGTLTFSKDNKHIILRLTFNTSIVYFNFDKSILNNKYLNFYGYLNVNSFNNNNSVQLIVTEAEAYKED